MLSSCSQPDPHISGQGDGGCSLGFTHVLSLGIDSWALSMLQDPFVPTDPLLCSLRSLRDANASFISRVLFCQLIQLMQRVPELAHGRGRESTAGSRQKKKELFPPHDLLFTLPVP